MEEYFLSLKIFKEQIKNIDLEEKYNELVSNNIKLTNLNLELETKVRDLDLKLKVRDEENASFKKNSLLSSMNKQIDELRNYISILEKQIKNYKSKNNDETNSDTNSNKAVNNQEPVKEQVKEQVKEPEQESVKELVKEAVKEPVKEPVKEAVKEAEQEPEQELVKEPEQEYETLEYNGKLYYKIKRKIYKINKDKTIGNQIGVLKNGEIIKKV